MIQAKSKGRYSRYRDITEPFLITARIEGEKAVSKACPYQSQYAFIGIHKEKLRRMAGGYACATSWILFMVILVMTIILFVTSKKWVYYDN